MGGEGMGIDNDYACGYSYACGYGCQRKNKGEKEKNTEDSPWLEPFRRKIYHAYYIYWSDLLQKEAIKQK